MILRPWRNQNYLVGRTEQGHSQSFCVCEQMTPRECSYESDRERKRKSSTVYDVHRNIRCTGLRCTGLGMMPSCITGDWRCSAGFYTLSVYSYEERQGTDHPSAATRV